MAALWRRGLQPRPHARQGRIFRARKGGRIGAVYAGKNWGARTNLRYVLRDFEADNDFYGYPRRDKEYHAGAALWHNKLAWQGAEAQFPLSENRQQYAELLFALERAMVCERGEGFLAGLVRAIA